ncbi:hypothetical protein PpBr36_00387 [Pyricularia pennisetigena]|uniref:hypothetical protein n=1 Tax=Pyricularia pennisetigena TaxID=1578925 RepID=UPI00115229C3|nr:hypothetical protein PpBr36_00387 [Pyricularia pennisetigena]TLS28557.1 hypothetical protein PpBr36_00387 [Pyricularia pennisetigena]
MSSAEDQDLLARIGQLAGQINRHKSQQAGVGDSVPALNPTPSHHYHPYHSAGHASQSWGRGRGSYRSRVARGGHIAPHRHRTLILNTNTTNDVAGDGSKSVTTPHSATLASASAAPFSASPSWVTKKDRNLQLINSAVYERESLARSTGAAEARRQKFKMLNQRERAKLLRHFQNGSGHAAVTRPATNASATQYEVVIEGIKFHVAKNGSKLVKVADNNAPKATPKQAVVGGVKFLRSRNGNMVRHDIVKAQRYDPRPPSCGTLTKKFSRQNGPVRKVQTPCRIFSTTGIFSIPLTIPLKIRHYSPPRHSTATVTWLAARKWASIESCSLVCRDFGIYGYCNKGANCEDRHVFECPDFSNTGQCKIKGCKLTHRERASVLRKAVASKDEGDSEMEDVSSDEDDESVGSNDVDSDAVDEFLGEDENPDDDSDDFKEYIQL